MSREAAQTDDYKVKNTNSGRREGGECRGKRARTKIFERGGVNLSSNREGGEPRGENKDNGIEGNGAYAFKKTRRKESERRGGNQYNLLRKAVGTIARRRGRKIKKLKAIFWGTKEKKGKKDRRKRKKIAAILDSPGVTGVERRVRRRVRNSQRRKGVKRKGSWTGSSETRPVSGGGKLGGTEGVVNLRKTKHQQRGGQKRYTRGSKHGKKRTAYP